MNVDVNRVTSWLGGLSTLGWLLVILAVLVVVGLAIAGVVWWRRRAAAPAAAPVAAPPARPAVPLAKQLVADVQRFRRELPAAARRSLDAFHPIVVLGTESSGKAVLIERFVGVAQRRVELGPRAELAGGQLRCVLGSDVVVFAPSEEVVRAPRELVDAGLTRALGPALRRRAPLVVVCVSPEILDTQSAPQLAELGGALRAKLDVLAALRDEPCAVRVVLSDVPGFQRFDALFRLLQLPGMPAVLALERFDDAAVRDALLAYADEICRALTELTPRETLELVGFLEAVPQLAGALSVLFGELFAPAGELTPRHDGLYLVPATGGPNPLIVPDALLRPGTSVLLKHRLIGFSLAVAGAVALLASYRRDAAAWDHAAAAASEYDVKKSAHELDLRIVIRGYAQGRTGGLTDRLRPGFFVEGPAVVGCSFVEQVRQDALIPSLRETLAKPPGTRQPERMLHTAALLYASAGNELGQLVKDRLADWATGLELPSSLVTDYLHLARPYRDDLWIDRIIDVSKAPDVDELGDRLARFLTLLAPQRAWNAAELAEAVALKAQLRPAIARLARFGATEQILATPPLDRLAAGYKVNEARFHLLKQLAENQVVLGTLLEAVTAAPPATTEPRSFAALGSALAAIVVAGASAPELTLAIGGHDYKVEVGGFARAMRGDAVAQLVAGFIDRTAGDGARLLLAKPAQADEVALGITWPPGTSGATSHARMYTRKVFETEVAPAALGLRAVLDRLGDYPAARDQLAQLLGQALDAYATGYDQELARLIESFQVGVTSAIAAQRVLRVLSGSGSPLRALLSAVATDAALGLAGDKTSVFDAMAAVEDHYGPLAQLFVAGKAGDAFAAYQDVLRALGTQLAAPAAARPGAAAAPAPSEAFAARLSPAGVLAFATVQGAPAAPAVALDAWLADKLLTEDLVEVLRAPVRAVYALGARDVEAAIAAWDRALEAAADAELFSRFPFDRASGDDLDPQTLSAWLAPKRGRFAAELLPAMTGLVVPTQGWDGRVHHHAAQPCTGDPLCVRVPAQVLATFDRLAAAADLLWDAAGKPLALEVGVTPRPFALASAAPVPELVRLTVGETTAFYFNQRPKRSVMPVDWTRDQTASLSVQLKQDGRVLLTPPAVTAAGTPWSLFHLLQQAERRGSTYTWQIRLGPSQLLAVSYDVVDPTAEIFGAPRPAISRRRLKPAPGGGAPPPRHRRGGDPPSGVAAALVSGSRP